MARVTPVQRQLAHSSAPEPVSLDSVRPGTTVRVLAVDAGSTVGRRLRRMGFWPGAPVRVLRRAPLGDPIEYYVHGFRLALRRAEARCVRVQPE